MSGDGADEKPASRLRELSLGDLPDAEAVSEREQAQRARVAAHKARKTLARELAKDPRARLLEQLNAEEKLKKMTKRYDFDRKQLDLVLVAVYFIPVILKYTGALPFIQRQLIGTDEDGFNVLGHSLAAALGIIAPHIWLAEIYTAGLLFLRMPLKVGPEKFVVGFDGIEVPEKLRPAPGAPFVRRFVRWSDIRGALLVAGNPPAVRILGVGGKAFGELRWNLWAKDKKVFHKLLCQYTPADHPLRVLVERECGDETEH